MIRKSSLLAVIAAAAWMSNRPVFARTELVEAEDTSRVQYTGSWRTRADDTRDPQNNVPFSRFPQVHGGKIRRSEKPGDKAVFKFSGTSVSVIFLTGMAGGIVDAKIDGADRGSFSLYNNTYQSPPKWQMYFGAYYYEIVIANDLKNGRHTLELTVSGRKQFNWSPCGNRVDIDAFRFGDFPFATVTGKVTDPDGDAVHREVDYRAKDPGEAKIEIKGREKYTVYISDDGTYTLSGIRPGTYDVTVSARRFRAATRKGVRLRAGKEATVDFEVGIGPGHMLYNRIHVPRAGTPLLRLPGDTFEFTLNAAAGARGWSAGLSTPYNTYALKIVKSAFDEVAGWRLTAKLPADIPPELYDLAVRWKSGGQKRDTSVRAVKVYKKYRKEFYFIHHTDPQGGWDGFKEVTSEVNLVNPEFVITTGDNIPGPWRPGVKEWDWRKWHQFLPILNQHRVPTFSAPGNHCVGPGQTLMPTHYKQLIGRRYWSQRYGDYHILTLDNCIFNQCNAYKFDRGGYYEAREKWIVSQLEANRDASLTFLGIHVGMDNFTDLPGNSWYGAMKQSSRKNGCWIDKYGVDLVVHGHWGKDSVSTHGSRTPTLFVETRDITGKGKAYRLIRVKNGKLVSYTYGGDKKRSMTAGSLKISYARANDGTAARNTATITNDHNEHFEQGLVRFVMKKGSYKVEADPGKARMQQAVDSDDGRFTVCYVNYDIPARTKSTVKISKAAGR